MIRHIVAIDSTGGIGKDGVVPWDLPRDRQYFADMTRQFGGVVLMGRVTFKSIGRALVDRHNFVACRDRLYQPMCARTVSDLGGWLVRQQDVWVIGGASIYEQTLAQAGELYVTRVDGDFDCDTIYPEFVDTFELSTADTPETENGLTFAFEVYTPKAL